LTILTHQDAGGDIGHAVFALLSVQLLIKGKSKFEDVQIQSGFCCRAPAIAGGEYPVSSLKLFSSKV
jgi:hypothetical protein